MKCLRRVIDGNRKTDNIKIVMLKSVAGENFLIVS